MKKLLLTAVVAFSTLFASAQIMLLTTYDGDLDGASQLTGNVGVAFEATEQITAGVQRFTEMAATDVVATDETSGAPLISGDDTTFVMEESSSYNLFVRYKLKDDIYGVFQMPTKDGNDLARVGVGYSFSVMGNLYFEPQYTVLMKADKSDGSENGDRMGKFTMGIAYKL